MTPFVHEFYVNLRTGAAYERAKKPLSQGNALADKIVVHVQDCGSDVDLTGMGVSALVVRFDGQTVPLTGSIEGGAACVMLDKSSYAVPGEARVTVMLSAGEMVQTVLVLLLNVDTSQTSIVVDNGTIGDLATLLAEIANMREATEEAQEAAEAAHDAIDELQDVADSTAPPVIVKSNGTELRIDDAANRPARVLESYIVPMQSGAGIPSLDNVRTITGWDAIKLARSDGDVQDVVLTAGLPETVYGGVLDWLTGVLTVTHALGVVTVFDALYTNLGAGLTCGQANKWPGMRQGGGADGWCEMLPPVESIAHQTTPCVSFGGTSSRAIYAAYPAEVVGTTLEELNAYVAAHPLRVVVPLETPYTLQLTAQQLEMLEGVNVLQSDCGDTSVVYIADTRRYIDKGDNYADVAGLAFEADRAGSADVAAHAATADSSATAAHADDADTVRGVDVIAALAVAAGGIVCDAGGDVVSVADAAARNALSAVSAITPVQSGSGDPSPDNVRPISGWDTAVLMHAGHNLVRYPYDNTTMTRNGITFTDNGDGTVTANGTATDRTTFYLCSVEHPIHLKKGCSYTLTGAPGVSGAILYMQDTTFKQMVAHPINPNTTITADYSEYYMFLRVEAGATLDNAVFRPMLVMGDTAQEFEPYQGQMLSADLPETVYGGTLDWTTGTLTIARKGVRLTGEEDWTELTDMPDGQHAYQWQPEDYATGKLSGLCSHYTVNRGSYLIVNVVYFGNRITVNTVQETVADFKAWLAAQVEANTPVTVVYVLAAPYTIQLTPQQLQLLKGNNALWSTTGDTSLAYIADTKMYIDNAIAAIAANMIDA